MLSYVHPMDNIDSASILCTETCVTIASEFQGNSKAIDGQSKNMSRPHIEILQPSFSTKTKRSQRWHFANDHRSILDGELYTYKHIYH